MSYINNISIKLTLNMVLALAIIFFGAQRAAAIPTGPLGCAGVFDVGGCAPYGQVIFDTGTSGTTSLFEYDNVVLDYSATGAGATVRGVVDLANGTVKTFASGIDDGNPSTASGGFIIAHAADAFTLQGTSASGLATFTVVLTADGVGSIANPGHTGQVLLGLEVSGRSDDDRALYQSGNNAPLEASFPLLSTLQGSQGNQLMASVTSSVLLNTPFPLDYSLRVGVSEGTTFDLSNTGRLSFILPAGMTITSIGGYSAGATSVPEPSSLLLLSSGLVALVIWRRKHAA